MQPKYHRPYVRHIPIEYQVKVTRAGRKVHRLEEPAEYTLTWIDKAVMGALALLVWGDPGGGGSPARGDLVMSLRLRKPETTSSHHHLRACSSPAATRS
jgi:hypothetical protein